MRSVLLLTIALRMYDSPEDAIQAMTEDGWNVVTAEETTGEVITEARKNNMSMFLVPAGDEDGNLTKWKWALL